jgi:putative membrane protein
MTDFLLWIPYLKALHIVFFTAWFAGLFYLVRIFVYHKESQVEEHSDEVKNAFVSKFRLMESRVYKIICRPAMILTVVFGVAMLVISPDYLSQGWMHIKLTLVILLIGYHHWCGALVKRFAKGDIAISSLQFRLLNEVPTLFLFAIVFFAVFRNMLDPLKAMLGIVLLGALLILATKMYKRNRERS